MTDANSPNLNLPYLAAGQSQKHVTLNQSLQIIDALLQCVILNDALSADPANPNNGDRYIVGASPSGAWANNAGNIAFYADNAWAFATPKLGWLVYVASSQTLKIYNGTAWVSAIGALQNLSLLGVGTSADANNVLAVKGPNALFSALETTSGGSGSIQFKLNKQAASNTASLLLQDNWSGRAEIGLCGDDRIHFKTSPDGSTWRDALILDPNTGQATFPYGVAAGDRTGFRNKLRNATFLINQRNVSGTVTLAAGAYGHDGVKAGAGGATYSFATSGIDIVITITAGTLIMPIEPGMIEGGIYTLSHAGSAQARIWQGTGSTGSGSYAAAPITTTSLTTNQQTNVEFSTGTVLRPQLEAGSVSTVFERRIPGIESMLCYRYFLRWTGATYSRAMFCYCDTTSSAVGFFVLPTPMRATPTCLQFSGLTFNNIAANFAVFYGYYNNVLTFSMGCAGGLTVGSMVQLYAYPNAGYIDLSAEI